MFAASRWSWATSGRGAKGSVEETRSWILSEARSAGPAPHIWSRARGTSRHTREERSIFSPGKKRRRCRAAERGALGRGSRKEPGFSKVKKNPHFAPTEKLLICPSAAVRARLHREHEHVSAARTDFRNPGDWSTQRGSAEPESSLVRRSTDLEPAIGGGRGKQRRREGSSGGEGEAAAPRGRLSASVREAGH